MLPIIHKKLRKDKIKNSKCPVVIQVYYQKERKQVFTGLFIEVDLWDEEKEQANSRHHDQLYFNRMLKNKVEDLEKGYFKQELTDGKINIQAKGKHSRKNFFDYANAYYNGLKNTASEHYINKCKTAVRDFKIFAGDINFQTITPQLLKEFEDHLFKLGRARNTINYIFKKIKQPFHQANKEGITDHNPFSIFQPVTYRQTKRSYLTMEQIRILELNDFGELNYIRDYFCICCRTGLRFGDMKKFDPKKDIITNNGVERIIIGTEKTGEPITLKLQPEVKDYIQRLSKPLPSNKHTNQLLKVLGEKAGFDTPLNFHQSRHSAAVSMASAGIPIEKVARFLGHTNIRTTAIYYKITDTTLDDAMDKWNELMKK